jgi:hypothetical protein
VGKQADLLDHVPDPAPELHGVGPGDVLLADEDPSAGGLDEAVDHLEGGRLAAARRAHEHADLALPDVEAEGVDRDLAVGKALGDGVEADHVGPVMACAP